MHIRQDHHILERHSLRDSVVGFILIQEAIRHPAALFQPNISRRFTHQLAHTKDNIEQYVSARRNFDLQFGLILKFNMARSSVVELYLRATFQKAIIAMPTISDYLFHTVEVMAEDFSRPQILGVGSSKEKNKSYLAFQNNRS